VSDVASATFATGKDEIPLRNTRDLEIGRALQASARLAALLGSGICQMKISRFASRSNTVPTWQPSSLCNRHPSLTAIYHPRRAESEIVGRDDYQSDQAGRLTLGEPRAFSSRTGK
jgi:hypothetical protein